MNSINKIRIVAVTLCLVCAGLIALPTAQGQTLFADGGVNLKSTGYLFNVPDLQPSDFGLGFTNAALTDYVINIGQMVGHYADGVAITNALDLLPYVGQSLQITDTNGNTVVSLSDTGIYLHDDVTGDFFPITVTNGNLFFNGNLISEQAAASELTLLDQNEGAAAVVTIDGGTLNVDGSPVNTDDQALSLSETTLMLEDGGDAIDLDTAFATDSELSTAINNLGSTYVTNNLDVSVYGDATVLELLEAPTTWLETFDHSHPNTASMMLRVSFTTGTDVTTGQLLWEIGGRGIGAQLYIQDGELRFIAGSTANVVTSGGTLLPETDYIVTTVVDGDANTVNIYLVDSLNYPDLESQSIASATIEDAWHGTGDFGLGTPSIPDGMKLETISDFLGTDLNSADIWLAGGVVGDTYNSVVQYGDVASGDLVSHQGILYRNLSGTVNADFSPDQDADNWEAITQNSDMLSLAGTTLSIDGGNSVDLSAIDTTIANTDDQTLSISNTVLQIEDGGDGIDLDTTFATDTELSTAINNLGSTYATTEEVNAINNLDVSVYGDMSELELLTAPTTWSHDVAHGQPNTASIIIRVSFTTGADVTTGQLLWEIGGAAVGSLLYIEDGELKFIAGSTTNVVTSGGTILPETNYIVTTVVDGDANSVNIYLVDSLNYPDLESQSIASATVEDAWHGSGAFGLGTPSTQDGAMVDDLSDFLGTDLNSADVWTSGGVVGDTYDTVVEYGDVASGDLVSHQGILYRNLSGTVNADFSPDQDADNWEAITQNSDMLSLAGTTLSIDGGNSVDLSAIDTTIANTDDQTLSISNTVLQIEDGGDGIDLDTTFATDSELSTVSNTLSAAITDASGDGPASTDNVQFYYDFSETLEVNNERNGGVLTGIANLTPGTNQTLGAGYSYVASEADKLSRLITSTDTFTFFWSGIFEDAGNDHALFDNRNGRHMRFYRDKFNNLNVFLNNPSINIFPGMIPLEMNTPYFITLRVRPNGANTDYSLTVNGTEYNVLDSSNVFDSLGGTLHMNELQTALWPGTGFISEVGLVNEWYSLSEIARLENLYRNEENPYDPATVVNTDNQVLAFDDTTLSIDGGNSVDLDTTFATDSELTSVSNALSNAGDFFADGSVPMTGDLDMDNNSITNVACLYITDPSTGDNIKLEFVNGELLAGGEPLLLSPEKMQQIALALLSYDVNADGSVDASTLVSGGSGTGAYEYEVIEGGATLSNNTLSWTTMDVPFTLRARRLGDVDYFTSLWYSRVYDFYAGPVFPLDDTKFTATNPAAQDFFGTAIAIDGNTFVVGVENDDDDGTSSGSVYIFTYNGTAWIPEKLTASDAMADDKFGSSVAIEGDTLVVGVEGADTPGGANAGSIYIYERINGVWTFDEEFYPATQGSADLFGANVAIDGGTIVVGAAGYNTNEGAVYVITPSGENWTEQRLMVADSADDDRFGTSVAIDGGTIVVGTPAHDQNGSNAGTAYVFTNTGGTWSSVEVLAADGIGGDSYGISVAVSGDTIAVGAINADHPGAENSGTVYVYTYDGSSWVEEATLTAETPIISGIFGMSVALEEDTLVVGEPRAHVNSVSDQGVAYVFQRSNGSWTQEQQLTAADGVANDQLGDKVALSGARVLSAGSRNAHSGFTFAGAVYLFE